MVHHPRKDDRDRSPALGGELLRLAEMNQAILLAVHKEGRASYLANKVDRAEVVSDRVLGHLAGLLANNVTDRREG